jgi:hypothetical protein
VLVALAFMTVALQALVREATGLSRREMLAPQLPAMLCAALVAGVLLATDALLSVVLPDPAAWQQFFALAAAAALTYAAFVLFAPFAAVRAVVNETIDDLLPPGPARLLRRLQGLAGQQA